MSPMVTLLLSLLAASAIGFVIGWLARRISAITQHNDTVSEAEARIDSLTSKLRTSLSETSRVSEKLQQARSAVNAYEKSSKQSVHNTNETIVDLKRRDQRIKELEARLQVAEEQHTRIQRENAQLRLNVRAGPDRQADRQVHPGVKADEDLPVLKKKATATAGATNQEYPTQEYSRQEYSRTPTGQDLPDITDGLLDADEDVFDMTSEFDFDPAELLGEESDFDEVIDKLAPRDLRRS